MRTFDSEKMIESLWEYRKDLSLFDPCSWLEDYNNVALEKNGSYSLFEHAGSGVYNGHYFFKVRGREALSLGKEMLSHFFENYPVNVVRGFTPLEKRAARWMARQLGFSSQGPIEINGRWCELFVLTEQQYKEKQ